MVAAMVIGVLVAALSAFISVDIRTMIDESPTPAAGFSFLAILFLPFLAIGVWTKAYTQTRLRNYAYHRVTLESTLRLRSDLRVGKLFWIYFSNILLLVLTLGLAYPWTMIRLARYRLSTIGVSLKGNLDSFITQIHQHQSAFGEELGEAFDLDLDLGL